MSSRPPRELTRDQRAAIRKQVTKCCANYDKANIACREAIEQAITDNYRDNRLGTACVQQVLQQFDPGYSKKFRAAHEAEILLHQTAKKYFDEVGITKLPSVKALREEYAGLLEQKRKAYSAYKQARADMKELYNVRANVEHLLDIPTGREPQRESQKSRQ